MKNTYKVSIMEEEKLMHAVSKKADNDSLRLMRYYHMPDLSRTVDSPLHEIVKRVTSLLVLKDFDDIDIPEVIPTKILFDLFNFPSNHPARSKSDTYYVDEENVLRTHDTVMWYYYLGLPEIKQKISNNEDLGVVCYGKVYRKDEIDRHHMNIFHQFGGLYLQPDTKGIMSIDELKKVLSQIVKSIFGEDVKFRFNIDTFPYTDPSLEVEVEINGKWIEILGGGMPRKSVLKEFGLEGYNGWAFGFGLERLAIVSMELPDIRLLWSEDERVKKQLILGNKFKEVSKFPAVVRDISFVVPNSFIPNDYFDRIREVGEGFVEEVELLDKYENEAKFGAGKLSYTFRITYRHLNRTLTNSEVNDFHSKIEEMTTKEFGGAIRLV